MASNRTFNLKSGSKYIQRDIEHFNHYLKDVYSIMKWYLICTIYYIDIVMVYPNSHALLYVFNIRYTAKLSIFVLDMLTRSILIVCACGGGGGEVFSD